MGKKISILYGIFSIAFFIALFILFSFRVREIKIKNEQRVSAGFDQVRHLIETTYIRQESFDSMDFKDTINRIFSADKDLDLLVVYSYDTGIEYLRARDSRYLAESGRDIASIRGVPRFSYNNFSRTQITSSITVPRKSSFIIEGVYRVLHNKELFSVLRDTVIILIVFALITAVLAFLLNLFNDKSAGVSVKIPLGGVRVSPRSFQKKESPAAGEAFPNRDKNAAPPPAEGSGEPEISAPPKSRAPAVQEQAAPLAETPVPAESAAPQPLADEKAVPAPEPSPKTSTPEQAKDSPAEESIFSSGAGSGWQAVLEKRLSLELERSAYNEQDLTLILLKIAGLSQNSEDYRWLAREIQNKLSFEDLTFEYPPDGYAVVLPNSNLDQSIGTLKNFLKNVEPKLLERHKAPLCGLTSRNGRLIDGARLFLEGEEALRRTQKKGADRIIGFRPDPGKYRTYISEQGPADPKA